MVKNICLRESYKDKQGNEKISWPIIGVLIETKEGKQYVKLYHMPGALMNVFTPKAKEEPKKDVPDVNLDNDEVDLA